MPKYIEIDKNLTIPTASASDRVTLGITPSGKIKLVDSNGDVIPITPYKEYIAKISQTSTSNPTVNSTLNNTLGFTPEWIRYNEGRYFFNFPESVDYNKIYASISPLNNIWSTSNVSFINLNFNTITGYPDYPFMDNSFANNVNSNYDNIVYSILQQPDSKILVGGNFTRKIDRINFDGTSDTSFYSNIGYGFTNGPIYSIALQPDGKIICAGSFNTFNSFTTTNNIARLNSDGTLDTAFNSNIGSGFGGIGHSVNSVAFQPDGKILCGGDFSTYNGSTISYGIARLNANGTLDTTFNTNAGEGFRGGAQTVYAIALQPDGKILVGGNFHEFNYTSSINLARLNADGTLDTTFTANVGSGFDSPVYTIALQSDGKIWCGGGFEEYNGSSIGYGIARLTENGVLDYSNQYTYGFNNTVKSILLQPGVDSIIVGGDFTSFQKSAADTLWEAAHIIRLDNNGNVLNPFSTTGTFNGNVYALSTIGNGKIAAGGEFTRYDTNNFDYTANYLTALYSSFDVMLTTWNMAYDSSQDGHLDNNPIEVKLYK